MIQYPALKDNGWALTCGSVSIVRDMPENMAEISQRVNMLTTGCQCKSGCNNRQCKCQMAGKRCGPGCKCHNCKNSVTHLPTLETVLAGRSAALVYASGSTVRRKGHYHRKH
eukprot:scpid98648/ scgid13945/ 